MRKPSYKEKMRLWEEVQNVKYGREARDLHRRMKKAGMTDGLPLFMRYPHLPEIILVGTSLLLVICIILGLLVRLLK